MSGPHAAQYKKREGQTKDKPFPLEKNVQVLPKGIGEIVFLFSSLETKRIILIAFGEAYGRVAGRNKSPPSVRTFLSCINRRIIHSINLPFCLRSRLYSLS